MQCQLLIRIYRISDNSQPRDLHQMRLPWGYVKRGLAIPGRGTDLRYEKNKAWEMDIKSVGLLLCLAVAGLTIAYFIFGKNNGRKGNGDGKGAAQGSARSDAQDADRTPVDIQDGNGDRAGGQNTADQKAADQGADPERSAADRSAADQRAADQNAADQRDADQNAADQKAADEKQRVEILIANALAPQPWKPPWIR